MFSLYWPATATLTSPTVATPRLTPILPNIDYTTTYQSVTVTCSWNKTWSPDLTNNFDICICEF